MRHVAAVERLLVVHKAWKFSLLDLLAAQHQHPGGERRTRSLLQTLQTEGLFHLTRHFVSTKLTASGPQKTARACRPFLGPPPSAAATDLHGEYGMRWDAMGCGGGWGGRDLQKRYYSRKSVFEWHRCAESRRPSIKYQHAGSCTRVPPFPREPSTE